MLCIPLQSPDMLVMFTLIVKQLTTPQRFTQLNVKIHLCSLSHSLSLSLYLYFTLCPICLTISCSVQSHSDFPGRRTAGFRNLQLFRGKKNPNFTPKTNRDLFLEKYDYICRKPIAVQRWILFFFTKFQIESYIFDDDLIHSHSNSYKPHSFGSIRRCGVYFSKSQCSRNTL